MCEEGKPPATMTENCRNQTSEVYLSWKILTLKSHTPKARKTLEYFGAVMAMAMWLVVEEVRRSKSPWRALKAFMYMGTHASFPKRQHTGA